MPAKRTLIAISTALLLLGLAASTAAATRPKDRGLLITPVRQYANITVGSQKTGSLTVANLTSKPMVVKFAVKQFSVTDYVYDYRFDDPKNNWVMLSTPQAAIQPGESKTIHYTISVPRGSAPGGHYYTLFASSNLSSSGLGSTIQAASLLYLTVNGALIQTGQLKHASIQHIAFGKQISYSLDILNTGNVHYFAYVSGHLHGLTTRSDNETTHLLLPHAIRRVSGVISAPVLPGVYKATYGYRTDAGAGVHQASGLVLYIPLWSIAAVLLLLLGVLKAYQLKRQSVARQQRRLLNRASPSGRRRYM